MFDLRKLELDIRPFSKGGDVIATGSFPDYPRVDGVPDKTKIIGRRISVVFPQNGYESMTVRVADPVDNLTAALEQANGSPVRVAFDGFTARFYQIEKRVIISAKADRVKIVPDAPDAFDLDLS